MGGIDDTGPLVYRIATDTQNNGFTEDKKTDDSIRSECGHSQVETKPETDRCRGEIRQGFSWEESEIAASQAV